MHIKKIISTHHLFLGMFFFVTPGDAAQANPPKMVKLKDCMVLPHKEVQSTLIKMVTINGSNPKALAHLFRKAQNPVYKLPKDIIELAKKAELLLESGAMHPYTSSILISGGFMEGDLFIFNSNEMYADR